MPRRHLLPLALLLVAAAPMPAHAAGGGLSIRPSRLEADVHRGGLVPPIAVENTSDRPIEVTAQPLKATADLSGQPVYDDSRAGRRAGDALLRPSPRRFVLAPHTGRRVRARVLACPQQGRGLYGVMSFTAVPRAAGAGARNGIQSALRLTATMLLSYGTQTCLDGRITGLRAAQAGAGRVSFFLRVRNDGELHQRPRAGLAIRRGTRTLYRGAFPMENVLPSTEREIELVLPIRLPAGRYTAVASTRLGPHASRRTSGFELTGTNRLPTPRLSLAPLQVTGLHTGESPAVHATLANRGSGPGSARVRFSAGRLGAGLPLETKLVQARKLTAGDHRELTARFAALPNGRYQLAAELIVAGRVVDSRRLNVEVRAPAGLPDRLRDWLSAHALMALLTLALMFAAVGVVLVRRRRPVAAPPAPVPTDELADLRRTLERLEARAAEDRSRKSA